MNVVKYSKSGSVAINHLPDIIADKSIRLRFVNDSEWTLLTHDYEEVDR